MRWLIPIERYRIQCDVFQGMWLILCELCKRLEAFYKKSKVKRVVFRASLWQTQPKHKFKSFSRSIFHCSIFGYRTKHYLLFNNYIRSSCLDTSWSTALGVWYVTSQCWLTYIPLLGFWLSDKTFVLFDLLVLSVWISDETLLLVFDILVIGVWTPDETLLLVFDIFVIGVWISDDMLLFRVWYIILIGV